MPIKLAKKVGFCFGVKRAVSMAEAVLKKEGKAYSLGSLIHNRQVVEQLSECGLKVVHNTKRIKKGVIIISSHGISPKVARRIVRRNISLVDTTCPFVLNAQRIARSLGEQGYAIVIVGDSQHPEVRALVDFVSTKAYVIKDKKEARSLRVKPSEKIGVVSQTTQSMDNFLRVVEALLEKRPNELKVINTICKDAEVRQEAARQLAGQVGLMLIVGGRNSANTKRLFDVCRKILRKSYLVETEGEVKKQWFKGVRTVGITSGASTPDWAVQRVAQHVQKQILTQ